VYTQSHPPTICKPSISYTSPFPPSPPPYTSASPSPSPPLSHLTHPLQKIPLLNTLSPPPPHRAREPFPRFPGCPLWFALGGSGGEGWGGGEVDGLVFLGEEARLVCVGVLRGEGNGGGDGGGDGWRGMGRG